MQKIFDFILFCLALLSVYTGLQYTRITTTTRFRQVIMAHSWSPRASCWRKFSGLQPIFTIVATHVWITLYFWLMWIAGVWLQLGLQLVFPRVSAADPGHGSRTTRWKLRFVGVVPNLLPREFLRMSMLISVRLIHIISFSLFTRRLTEQSEYLHTFCVPWASCRSHASNAEFTHSLSLQWTITVTDVTSF